MDRIVKDRQLHHRDVGFVRVTMEDGAQGWGQVSTYHADITCTVLHRGRSRHGFWAAMRPTSTTLMDWVTEREHKFPGSYLRRAMGGRGYRDLGHARAFRAGPAPWPRLSAGSPGAVRCLTASYKLRRDITTRCRGRAADTACGARTAIPAFKVRRDPRWGSDRDEWPGRTER